MARWDFKVAAEGDAITRVGAAIATFERKVADLGGKSGKNEDETGWMFLGCRWLVAAEAKDAARLRELALQFLDEIASAGGRVPEAKTSP